MKLWKTERRDIENKILKNKENGKKIGFFKSLKELEKEDTEK